MPSFPPPHPSTLHVHSHKSFPSPLPFLPTHPVRPHPPPPPTHSKLKGKGAFPRSYCVREENGEGKFFIFPSSCPPPPPLHSFSSSPPSLRTQAPNPHPLLQATDMTRQTPLLCRGERGTHAHTKEGKLALRLRYFILLPTHTHKRHGLWATRPCARHTDNDTQKTQPFSFPPCPAVFSFAKGRASSLSSFPLL